MNHAPVQAPFRLRTLLPVEHGSWVFLMLPMAVGLLKAPSWGGGGLGVASLAVFLARTPLQRWNRLVRGTRFYGALALLGALALGGLALALRRGGLPPVLLLGVGGLALLPALTGSARRALGPELLGAAGSAALLPALLLAGGWTLTPALAAFAALVLLVLPPFLFVRRQVAWARGTAFGALDQILLHGSHALACAVAVLAWREGGLSPVLPAWAAVLWGRSLVVRAALPARKVGWLEAGAAVLHGVILVVGLRSL